MMKTIKKAILFLAVLTLLAAGCVQPVLENPATPGAGVLRVSLDGGAQRTLMPGYDTSSLYYTLTFTAAGGPALAETQGPVSGHIGIGGSSGEFTLAAGTWDLDVKGFASVEDAADPAKALVSGSESGIEVSSSEGTAVNVTLTPDKSKLTQAATGTLRYDISFPPEVTLASLAVYGEDGVTLTDLSAYGATVSNPITLIGENAGSITLASGVYNLGISLYMDGKIAVRGASAHIYDGLVTAAVYVFTADDFAGYSPDVITAFTLKDGTTPYTGKINQAARIIGVSAPGLGDLIALTAELTHSGLSVSPDPATARDYTNPVIYTVSLEDGTQAAYTVRVDTRLVITSVAALTSFLSSAPEGSTVDDPIPVKIEVDLTNTVNGWAAMLSAINSAQKYLDLDLSECTMAGMTAVEGEFDPGTANTGEKYITGLVLPDTAASIKAGISYSKTFQYFTGLKTLGASGVETVGQNAFYGCTSLASVELPVAVSIGYAAFWGCTSLESVELPLAASIGNGAFRDCTSLASVELPTATDIGIGAFTYCTNLASVSLPVAVSIGGSAFYGCTSLESVELPAATSIESGAFYNCTSLASVELPAAVSFGDDAFWRCTSLESVELPAAVSFGDEVFYGCTSLESVVLAGLTTINTSAMFFEGNNLKTLSLPEVTTVGQEAFKNNTHLESIVLPKAANIGNSAFKDCTNLVSVELPAATSIGENAFYGCTSLVSVELPAATSIGGSAFSGCTSLASVDLPAATSIGGNAFYGCTSLASVELPKAVSIRKRAFYGCTSLASVSLPAAISIDSEIFILDGVFSYCTSLTSVELPVAESIGSWTFENCTSLVSVELPAAYYIGDNAFQDCTSLASVELPAAESIGSRTFYGCTSLTSVELPAATSIREDAFYGCTSLASVELPKAVSIKKKTFYGCTSLASVELPVVTDISEDAFKETGETSLTIIMGDVPSQLGINIFNNVSTPKSVTVMVPPGATYSNKWREGFKGLGWYNFPEEKNGSGTVNPNITLTIDYLPE
jgi:hypothetical protein